METSHSKTAFGTKSREEILKMAELMYEAAENEDEMTEQEMIEYDAEFGYYPDDDDYVDDDDEG